MNALPLFDRLLTAIARHKLEVVLIGNAAAAIHGAPVTTVDFDFMFRDTPANMRKHKAVASTLEAVILRPYYPVSKLYRMVDDARGLQADFMPVIHGVRSFGGLRARATEKKNCWRDRHRGITRRHHRQQEGGWPGTRPCRAARARTDPQGPRHSPPHMADLTWREKKRNGTRRQVLAALAEESERHMAELNHRRIALPVEKRMNFLRKRLPGGGSCL